MLSVYLVDVTLTFFCIGFVAGSVISLLLAVTVLMIEAWRNR